MNTRQRVRVEMFQRVAKFGQEHAEHFIPKPPATGPTHAQTLFEELEELIPAIINVRTRQDAQGSATHSGATDKGSLRDALLSDMRAVVGSMSYLALDRRQPAWMDRFRMPIGTNDEQMVTRARAFVTAVRELNLSESLVALEHEADFLELLEARIAEFAAAEGEKCDARADKVGATADLASLIARGLTVVRGLSAVMTNKFKSDAGMLGAWKSASHVERTGERPKVPGASPTAVDPTGATLPDLVQKAVLSV